MNDQTQLLREALEAYEHAIANGHREHDALGAFSGINIPELARAALSHPAQPAPDACREAVQEECDLLHIPVPSDAREAVKAVVAANVRIALDPAVSREAQALIDQGKAQPQGAWEVTVSIDLIRRAQQAINYHLEPNSPVEHESTMVELEAIGWPDTTPPASQQAAQAAPEVTDAQILAAARALNKLAAEACQVDEADQWALYGNSFISDAAVILRAAKGEQ